MVSQKKDGGDAPKKKAKKKFPKKLLVITVIGVVAAAVYFFAFRPGAPQLPSVSTADISTLKEGEFIRSVSAKGTVKSADSTPVYCSLAYAVEDVFVKVGDKVTAGQPLAKLDEQSILDKIESQQASIDSSRKSSDIQIKSANDTYKAAKAALENGEDTGIMSAQQQVVSAWENYEKAVKTYERQQSSLQNGLNQSILSTESSALNANASLENARINLNDAKAAKETAQSELQIAQSELRRVENELQQALAQQNTADQGANTADAGWQSPAGTLTSGTISTVEELQSRYSTLKDTVAMKEQSLNSAISQLEKAQISFDDANASYNINQRESQNTMNGAYDTLDDYKTAVNSAYNSYLAAEANLKAAQTNANNQLQSYKNSLEGAQASADNKTADISLKQMQEELDSTNITAPCSGTITGVYAEVGKSGSGLLFVIEDLQNLIVESTVKEYDIGTVKPGMAVKITSDATGGLVIPGVVSSIDPISTAAAASAAGSTTTASSSNNVEFSSDIAVSDKDTGLLIGMTVELEYIIGSMENAMSVPYDAVYKNDAGDDCVLILQDEGDGKYLVKETPVKILMENDVNIAVSSSALSNGMQVLSNGSDNRQLAGQTITLGVDLPQNLTTTGMAFGGPGGGGPRMFGG